MSKRLLLALVSLAVVGRGIGPGAAVVSARDAARSAAARLDALRTAQRRHGLDPATSIASRVRRAPASLLEDFHEAPPPPAPDGTPSPAPRKLAASHQLTGAERRVFDAAMAGLTPLQQRVLRDRLQAVYFIDAPGMPGTALTRTVNPDEPSPLFDVIIRGSIFRETTSEWLTTKERSCFDTAGSTLQVFVEAGALEAIRYAMLHEATHMVDRTLALTPPWQPPTAPDPAVSPFTRGVWTSPLDVAEAFDSPLLRQSRFRREGTVLPIAQAAAVYEALERTPFVSLYASSNWSDDLAEYLTVSHWTARLGQPFRIVIRDGSREVFAYEPMGSPLVRRRLDQVARFYER